MRAPAFYPDQTGLELRGGGDSFLERSHTLNWGVIECCELKEGVLELKAYQLKISLVDSKPCTWRRVVIPADVTFRRLHDTIQFSMGWHDYHLYEFEFPDEKLRITNDDEAYQEYKFYTAKYKGKKLSKKVDPHGFILRTLETTIKQPERVKIDRFFEGYKNIPYVYDFGDYWQHEIVLEQIIEDYQFGYPTCLAGEGDCPPEDVGGLRGYEDFLEAWKDPNHPGHQEMVDWAEGQHYRGFDIDWVNHSLKVFLKLKKVKL